MCVCVCVHQKANAGGSGTKAGINIASTGFHLNPFPATPNNPSFTYACLKNPELLDACTKSGNNLLLPLWNRTATMEAKFILPKP